MSDLDDIYDRLNRLDMHFDSSIVAGAGWSGSRKWGVLFNPVDEGSGEGTEGGVISPPPGGIPPGPPGGVPPPGGTPFGACCDGSGNCTVITEIGCLANGGTYQGDFTECTPNPCVVAGGACCNMGICSIMDSTDCWNSGGVYMGDGTSCSPNPCTFGVCACSPFAAFDGSGRHFQTKTRHSTGYESRETDYSTFSFTIDVHQTTTRVDTCAGCNCSGTTTASCVSGDCSIPSPSGCPGTVSACCCEGTANSCFGSSWSGCDWIYSPVGCWGSPQECDSPCVGSFPPVVISATYRTQNDSCTGPNPNGHTPIHWEHTASEYLSDECHF